jgi:hypothetical protein
MIAKTVTVLDYQYTHFESALFESPLDGESEKNSFYHLFMLKKTYNELGCPQKITVTIEPGDELN